MNSFRRFVLVVLVTIGSVAVGHAPALACSSFQPCTEVDAGAVTVGQFGEGPGGPRASNSTAAPDFRWRLRSLCEVADATTGACSPADFRDCPQPPGRTAFYYIVERRPIVQSDGTAMGEVVPPGTIPGALVGEWVEVYRGCVDITDLDLAPSPGEVYQYFRTLPLPQLATQHQPPFDGLSQLPVIFYTDSPTTQTFTVDIRGFTVVIDATAELYTWHTGEPFTITNSTTITSADPGRPYPNQTVTNVYNSGTYTAWLTVTWGATFTVNGGAAADVPGTTTTDGPSVTFRILQAHAVLIDPYG